MKNINPTTTTAWKSLQNHFSFLKSFNLKEAFKDNPSRADELSISFEDFYVDFSKNLINSETKSAHQKIMHRPL